MANFSLSCVFYIFQKIMENSVSRKFIAMEWNVTLVLCISLFDIIQLLGRCNSEFQQFVHTGIPIFVSDFMDGPASNAIIENILFLNWKILDRFFFYTTDEKKPRRAQMVDIEKEKILFMLFKIFWFITLLAVYNGFYVLKYSYRLHKHALDK